MEAPSNSQGKQQPLDGVGSLSGTSTNVSVSTAVICRPPQQKSKSTGWDWQNAIFSKAGKLGSTFDGFRTSGRPTYLEKCFWKTYSPSLFTFMDRRDKYITFAGLVLAFCTGMAVPAFLLATGGLVKAVGAPGLEASPIGPFVFAQIGIGVGCLFATSSGIFLLELSSERQLRRLQADVFEALLRQEVAWLHDSRVQTLPAKFLALVGTFRSGTGAKWGQVVQFSTAFLGGYGVAFYRAWRLALVLTTALPVVAGTIAIVSLLISSHTRHTGVLVDQASGLATEALTAIETVVAYNAESYFAGRYARLLEKAMLPTIRASILSGVGIAVVTAVLFASYAVGFWYGGMLIAWDRLAACVDCLHGGDVLTSFLGVVLGALALGQAVAPVNAVLRANAAATELVDIMHRKSRIDPNSQQGIRDICLRGEIEFQNVSFTVNHQCILKDVSFCIPAGSTTVLVGESGSGKSSIISLMERFYDPSQGTILVDGVDIKAFQLSWFRKQTGLFSQEPQLFARTVRENIIAGTENVSEDWFEEVVQVTGVSSFSRRLPQGLDTFAGSGGVLLSTGQKHRIAMARALLRDPSLLFLDEPTDSDGVTETSWGNEANFSWTQDAFKDLFEFSRKDRSGKPRTIILATHRLLSSVVQNADLILVIKKTKGGNGYVVERGKHADLVNRPSGIYRRMLATQREERRNNRRALAAQYLAEISLRSQRSLSEPSKYKQQQGIVTSFLPYPQFNSPKYAQGPVPLARAMSVTQAVFANGLMPPPAEPDITETEASRHQKLLVVNQRLQRLLTGSSNLPPNQSFAATPTNPRASFPQMVHGFENSAPKESPSHLARLSSQKLELDSGPEGASEFSFFCGKEKEEQVYFAEEQPADIDDVSSLFKAPTRWTVLSILGPQQKVLFLAVLGALAAGCVFPFFTLLAARYLDIYFAQFPEEIIRRSATQAPYFLGLGLTAFAALSTQKVATDVSAAYLSRRLRAKTFESLLYQDLAFHDACFFVCLPGTMANYLPVCACGCSAPPPLFAETDNKVAAIAGLLSTDTAVVASWAVETVPTVVQSIATVIAAVGVAASASLRLTVAVLAAFIATTPLALLKVILLQRALTQSSAGTAGATVSFVVAEALVNLKTVQANNLQNQLQKTLDIVLSANFVAGLRAALLAAVFAGISQLAICGCQALCLWYGSTLLRHGTVRSPGSLMRAIAALNVAAAGVTQTLLAITNARKAERAAMRLFTVMHRRSAIDSRDRSVVFPEKTKIAGGIRIQNLSFRYPLRPETPVLEDLSLSINPGEVVALVGNAGGGKTTIIKLLENLYAVDCRCERAARGPRRRLPVPQLPHIDGLPLGGLGGLPKIHANLPLPNPDTYRSFSRESVDKNIPYRAVDAPQNAKMQRNVSQCVCRNGAPFQVQLSLTEAEGLPPVPAAVRYQGRCACALSQGSISLDEASYHEVHPGFLRSVLGYVSQEPVLFQGSIRDNITLGAINAKSEDVISAAKAANAHTFISALPQAYDTEINSTALSGGEKQRIAIARALLRRPKILLLDEPTSALDTRCERALQKVIDKLTREGKRTILIVAHRASTACRANRVYVLGQLGPGRGAGIIESGTPAQLLALSNGHFRQLVKHNTSDIA